MTVTRPRPAPMSAIERRERRQLRAACILGLIAGATGAWLVSLFVRAL